MEIELQIGNENIGKTSLIVMKYVMKKYSWNIEFS